MAFPLLWGFSKLRHSEIVIPVGDMPIAEIAVLPDTIVSSIVRGVEGDQVY